MQDLHTVLNNIYVFHAIEIKNILYTNIYQFFRIEILKLEKKTEKTVSQARQQITSLSLSSFGHNMSALAYSTRFSVTKPDIKTSMPAVLEYLDEKENFETTAEKMKYLQKFIIAYRVTI